MKRLIAVVLVVASVVWARRLGETDGAALTSTALALGFTLVVASVAGDLFRRFRLPRLTGYLLFGLLVGPFLANVISEPMARQLQAINGIATTLIALIAGLTLNIERFGTRLVAIARMTGTMLAIALVGLFTVAWIAWPWLPVAPDAAGLGKLAMVALFVVIVISVSPTMAASGDCRDRFARAAQRSRACDDRSGRSRAPGAVLACDAAGARNARRGCRRGRQRARSSRLGDRGRQSRSGAWREPSSRSTCAMSGARSPSRSWHCARC